jgi:hypothetical protein
VGGRLHADLLRVKEDALALFPGFHDSRHSSGLQRRAFNAVPAQVHAAQAQQQMALTMQSFVALAQQLVGGTVIPAPAAAVAQDEDEDEDE